MIEQARGAPRLGFIFGTRRDLARETDRAIGEAVQTIAPGLRHRGAIIEPGMQIGGECGFRAVATDCAPKNPIVTSPMPMPKAIQILGWLRSSLIM